MSCEYEVIAVYQASQSGIEDTDIFVGDLRSLPVDRGLFPGYDLHVDTAHALLNIDEIIPDSDPVKKPLDLCSGESCYESHRSVLISEVLQRHRYIYTFSTGIYLLGSGSVDSARPEIIDLNNIVQRRTERNRIDQNSFLLIE